MAPLPMAVADKIMSSGPFCESTGSTPWGLVCWLTVLFSAHLSQRQPSPAGFLPLGGSSQTGLGPPWWPSSSTGGVHTAGDSRAAAPQTHTPASHLLYPSTSFLHSWQIWSGEPDSPEMPGIRLERQAKHFTTNPRGHTSSCPG